MSRTETHIGTLTEMKLAQGETVHDLMMRVLATHGKQPSDNDLQHEGFDMADYFNDTLNEKYLWANGNVYIISGYELEEGDSIDFMEEVSPGKFRFVHQFYNGATCFSEQIERSLNKINK